MNANEVSVCNHLERTVDCLYYMKPSMELIKRLRWECDKWFTVEQYFVFFYLLSLLSDTMFCSYERCLFRNTEHNESKTESIMKV